MLLLQVLEVVYWLAISLSLSLTHTHTHTHTRACLNIIFSCKASPSSSEFEEVEDESEERIRARLEHHQRAQERVACVFHHMISLMLVPLDIEKKQCKLLNMMSFHMFVFNFMQFGSLQCLIVEFVLFRQKHSLRRISGTFKL